MRTATKAKIRICFFTLTPELRSTGNSQRKPKSLHPRRPPVRLPARRSSGNPRFRVLELRLSLLWMLLEIENLLRLQEADKEIRRLQDEIAELPRRVAAIEHIEFDAPRQSASAVRKVRLEAEP